MRKAALLPSISSLRIMPAMIRTAPFSLLLALALAGCGGAHSASNDPPKASLAASELPQLPMVTVYRFTLPLGTLSNKKEAWKLLDQDALDAETTTLLTHNGLRAAVGTQAHWAEFATHLAVPHATQEQLQCQTDGQSTLNILTRPNITQQTLFILDPETQLQGRTFQGCDNAFRLAMNLTSDKSLHLELEPVILPHTPLVSSQSFAAIQGTTGQLGETLGHIRINATLKTGAFLLLCPIEAKRNRYSLGASFLCDLTASPPTEAVLVLTPLVPTPPPIPQLKGKGNQ